MVNNFSEIMKQRRSYYSISNQSPISDEQIEAIITDALLNVPSSNNSHIAKAILLLGKNHLKLWKIVEDSLRKIVPEAKFAPTQKRIDGFAAGYGTILYFNDEAVVKKLQEKLPTYKDDFPIYAEHGAGMMQFAIWCMLKEAGLGASLQHYGRLIEEQVANEWNIPSSYRLVAQMPFGTPVDAPATKKFPDIDELFSKFV